MKAGVGADVYLGVRFHIFVFIHSMPLGKADQRVIHTFSTNTLVLFILNDWKTLLVRDIRNECESVYVIPTL